jgi:hypothetical protein
MRYCGVIGELSGEDDRFQIDGGSWPNDVSWPRGYDDSLIPMQRASALFHERVLHPAIHTSDPDYRNALFHRSPAKRAATATRARPRSSSHG